MKALIFRETGEPKSVLQLAEIPTPPLAPGEALVRVLLSPINASDLHMVRGRYGYQPELPASPGIASLALHGLPPLPPKLRDARLQGRACGPRTRAGPSHAPRRRRKRGAFTGLSCRLARSRKSTGGIRLRHLLCGGDSSLQASPAHAPTRRGRGDWLAACPGRNAAREG